MRKDASGFVVRLDDSLVRTYTEAGKWVNQTLGDFARKLVENDPRRILLIDGQQQIACATLVREAQLLASDLITRGFGPGDTIAHQLPNWYEASVINLAAAFGGFVIVPLLPIYRESELSFILRECACRMLFIPAEFRRHDYVRMVEDIRPKLPCLRDVVVTRGSHPKHLKFEDLIAERNSLESFPKVDPNAVKLIMYTSGTTGRPKGVLHTHNTIMSDLLATVDFWHVTTNDVVFMPSPVTHVTGILYALELPFVTGCKAVLQDIWNAELGRQLIEQHGCTLGFGATPFLQELAAAARKHGTSLPTLRLFPCGGASVPPDLVYDARRILSNCRVSRIYGASEAPTVTLALGDSDPPRLGAETDGRIWNNEVRICHADTGKPLPLGEEGEILVRGPELFLGYTRAEDNEQAFDPEGYFRTGDLGRIDHDSFIVVTGRKKDLIIRGGENISPKEIEDKLVGHPAIADVAITSMPSERLGETVCAFVVPAPGQKVDLAEIRQFLIGQGLARQKIPEHVEVVAELPRTPSGKVRKNVLRDIAKHFTVDRKP